MAGRGFGAGGGAGIEVRDDVVQGEDVGVLLGHVEEVMPTLSASPTGLKTLCSRNLLSVV